MGNVGLMLGSCILLPASLRHRFLKMKKAYTLIGAFLFTAILAKAQHNSTSTKYYRNFPIIVTLQFQNLASPFHDLNGNFSNPGLMLGTEVSYSGRQNWVQQCYAGFYFNKNAGNGIMVFTQTVYRPAIFNIFTLR